MLHSHRHTPVSHHPVAHEPSKPAADPTPLALAGFSAIVMMVSCYYAGLISTIDFVSPLGMVAGLSLLLGSAYNFKIGHNLPASNFAVYGAFWLSISIHTLVLPHADFDNIMTFLRIPIAIYTFYAWVASFYVSKVSLFVMTTLELKLVLFIIGQSTGSMLTMKVGGCFGIACAAAGFYTSASLLLKPKINLPLGTPLLKPQQKSKDPGHAKRSTSGVHGSKRWVSWVPRGHDQGVLDHTGHHVGPKKVAP